MTTRPHPEDQDIPSYMATGLSNLYRIEVAPGRHIPFFPIPSQILVWLSDQALEKVLRAQLDWVDEETQYDPPSVGQLMESGPVLEAKEEEQDPIWPVIDQPTRENSPIQPETPTNPTDEIVQILHSTSLRGYTVLCHWIVSISHYLEGRSESVIRPHISSFEELSVLKLSKLYDTHSDAVSVRSTLRHAEQNASNFKAESQTVREHSQEDRDRMEASTQFMNAVSKISTLRHNYLAHSDRESANLKELIVDLKLELSEMCALYDVARGVSEKYAYYLNGRGYHWQMNPVKEYMEATREHIPVVDSG